MMSMRTLSRNPDGTAGRPFKTPARTRNENLINVSIPATLKGKGLALRTPPQNKGAAKDIKTASKVTVRPLGDKTPFPNRVAPNPEFQTKLKLSSTPDSVPRPSSLRKHIRLPRGSLGKAFQTPANTGLHWDTSDISITLPLTPEPPQEVIEEDTDEVEYAPPRMPEPPYMPPIDGIAYDYKAMGQKLKELSYDKAYLEYDPPNDPEPSDLGFTSWDMFERPEIPDDNDLFAYPKLVSRSRATAQKQSASKSTPVISRPKPLTARSKVTPTRPGTAAASTRPTTIPMTRSSSRATRPVSSATLRSRPASAISVASRTIPVKKVVPSRKPVRRLEDDLAKISLEDDDFMFSLS